jgi:uncharacterized repeat protein (TIGR01451 family)
MTRTWTFTFCMLLLLASLGLATPPGSPEAIAPLLFVRVQGPDGMAVTFLEAGGKGRTFDQPVTVGLRPCFIYRMRLSNIPGRPNVALYPSLEVRGTLRLPPRLRAADHPVPVVFDDTDFQQAINGVMVTKVILLEDADKTSAGVPFAGQPAQIDIAPDEDPLAYARTIGRPVLVVRLGLREPDELELARTGPGMILYPGEKALPPLSPTQKLYCFAPEPLPRSMLDAPEEVLRDGGDNGKPVYLEPGGQLRGLDPSDAVAEYTDSLGRRRLMPTNTVCLFVPRFIIIRHLTPSASFDAVREALRLDGRISREEYAQRQISRRLRQMEESETLRARQRAHQNLMLERQIRVEDLVALKAFDIPIGQAIYLGTNKAVLLRDVDKLRLARQIELAIRLSELQKAAEVGEIAHGPRAVGLMEGLGQVTGTLETRTVTYFCETAKPEIPERPLCLLKWCSAESAEVGDVVTFFIRYSNQGGRPIRNIAISDSLTGRLEYIPGSAKSDREAVFVTEQNEAGSLTLRWEIRDPLPPGQRGLVSFQARVR